MISDNDEMIVVLRNAERERSGVWSVVIHFWFVLLCCGGKILWRELSETIKAARMRERKGSVESAERE